MSTGTVSQLYKDLEKRAKTPGHFAEPATVAIFNANLAEAKSEYPDDTILRSIPEVIGQVRIGDLLVRTGQVKAALEGHIRMVIV